MTALAPRAALLALLALAPAAAGAAGVLTLDDARARAEAHPRLVQSRAALAGSRARVDEARAGWLPTGTAALGWGRSLTGDIAGSVPPSPESSSASVTVTQPIWDFGRTGGATGAARAEEQASAADLAQARLDVREAVDVAYFNALAAEQAVVVADDTILQMEKRLAFAQASLEVGRKTRFDVVRAEVDLANARIQRIQALNAAATARTTLGSAIGEELGAAALVRPEGPTEPDLDPPEAVRRALARRADVTAASRRIAAQRETLRAANATWYPVLGASAQGRWSDRDFLTLNQGWSAQVGATLTWPFLAGGADAARAREAESRLAGQQAALDSLLLQVRADAESAALAVAEAVARRGAAAVAVSSSREALSLAEGRYQAGAGSILEVTDAQAAYTTARYGELRAQLDAAVARARLAHAVGGP